MEILGYDILLWETISYRKEKKQLFIGEKL